MFCIFASGKYSCSIQANNFEEHPIYGMRGGRKTSWDGSAKKKTNFEERFSVATDGGTACVAMRTYQSQFQKVAGNV